MPSPVRQNRVADRIQAEISELIQREMKDPRLNLVTVTRVNIDRELEHANIFVSTLGAASRQKDVMRALENAKGFVRRELAHRIQLRRAPEMHFHWDPGPEKVEQVGQLLDQLKAPDETLSPAEETDADAE
ncbi:MAG: 30S ribosome-binding factor RbfA [Anaerolineales bacterium]